MTSSFVRSLYYGVLLAVPVCMAGVAYFAERLPGVRSDGIVQSAQASGRLEPLDGTTGMRLADVTTHRMSRAVHTYGNVGIDETSLYSISPKIDGWIRKLHVSAPGQRVTAGQILYEIYSPELVQRQREYIELLQRRDQLLDNMTDFSGQNAQMAASLACERIRTREKFAFADVGAATLAAIESTRRTVDRVPVYAVRSGFVTQIGAREGDYVTPMTKLLTVADVATVWLDIVLYPGELEWVREGDDVTETFPHSGRPPLPGHLVFALPTVDGATRTARARLTE